MGWSSMENIGKIKIKNRDKLRAEWKYDKEENTYDLVVDYPLGVQTNTDAGYLLSHVFTQNFINEIQKRGYDISTMKFEISPKIPTSRPDKFETINNRYISNYV